MRTIVCGLTLFGFVVGANAETVLLSEMDEETRVYIQRGNHAHNVECYEYVLHMIKQDNPGYDPRRLLR